MPTVDGDLVPPAPDPAKKYLLYLHVPYCKVLCPFCSFHRVRFKADSATRYFDCLQREIEQVSDLGYQFGELYVGGGTPTVLPGELLQLLDAVRGLHCLESISIETNPDDLDRVVLQRLHERGVRRLSVGVQSFDDELLGQMQRLREYGSGRQIVERLRRSKGVFDTLNVDMIFNFPHQSEASLGRDLEIITDTLDIDQVSWYPLMPAASTAGPMQRHMGGQPDESREKRLYEQIVEHMLTAGYARSSAWCFSRQPGLLDEYIVEHEEYVGLGSGSFSYLQGQLFASTFSINHYMRRVEHGQTGMVQRRGMCRRDQMRYYLLMRLFSGSLDLAEAERRFDGRFQATLLPELAALRFVAALRHAPGELRLTEKGYYLWVRMMREFFSAVSDLRDAMRHHIAAESVSLRRQDATNFGIP